MNPETVHIIYPVLRHETIGSSVRDFVINPTEDVIALLEDDPKYVTLCFLVVTAHPLLLAICWPFGLSACIFGIPKHSPPPRTGNASAWSSSVLEERHSILNPFGHGLHLDRADFDEVLRNTVVSCTSESKSKFLFEKGIRGSIERLWNVEMGCGC